MLKLERIHHHRDITIRLKGREPLWSRALTKAFGGALLLHFVGFSLLSIENPDCAQEIPMHAVMVEPDLGESTAAAEGINLPNGEEKEGITEHNLVPLCPFPVFSPISFQAVEKMEQSKELTVADDLFRSLEEKSFKPDNTHCHFIGHYEPLKINISGQISNYPIQDDGCSFVVKQLEMKEPLALLTVTYRVQLDSREGEVFWFEKVEGTGKKELDQLAETIIRGMRFQKDQDLCFVDGSIQFVFNVPPSASYRYLLSEANKSNQEQGSF